MLETKFLDNYQFLREFQVGYSALGSSLRSDAESNAAFGSAEPRIIERKRACIPSIPNRKDLRVRSDGEAIINLQIANAVFDVEKQRLFGPSGQQLFLRAQSAEILKLLIDNVGGLVSRDTIVEEVWKNVAVTDDSVTQCIRDIRKVVGDNDRTAIVTVPKRGYVLQANQASKSEVPKLSAGTLSVRGDAQSDSVFYGEKSRFDHNLSTAPKSLQFAESDHLQPQLDPRDIMPTLAILPFKGDGVDQIEIFGAFLADEIAKLLGLAEDVNIISRLSMGTIGGSAPELGLIKTQTNTDFVLSGYLINHGNKVAISLEFAETEKGYVLWSERLQLPFNPAAPETEGLGQIVANIRRSIMLNEMRRVNSRPLQDLKMFSILHGAVGLMHRFSRADFDRSKEFLEHLHNIAPRLPAPLAWMARWHVLNAVQGWTQNPEREAKLALELTGAALDLDPENTLALVCEGQVLVHLKQSLGAAEMRYDRALEANPNDANGRALRAMLRAFTDRGKLGKRDIERAMHLTPLDPHRFFYLALAAGVCIANEEFDRAVVLTKESLRLNRGHASSVRMLPVALLGANEGDDARKAAKDLRQQQPELRISDWLKSSPSAEFDVGRKFADMLRELGIPD